MDERDEMLLDVTDAGFRVLETFPPVYVLEVRGTAPRPVRVALRPARTVGPDGRWAVGVVGTGPEYGRTGGGRFSADLDVTRTIGPRGIRLVGATRVWLLDHPEAADVVEGGAVAPAPDVVEAVSDIGSGDGSGDEVMEGSDGDRSDEDAVEEIQPVPGVPEPRAGDRPATGPVVRGIVTDDAGWPLPGAWVVAYPAGTARCTADAAVRCDGSGRFRLPLREPGRIRVVAESDGFASASGETWVLPAGTGRVDLALTAVARRPGPVLDRHWEVLVVE